MQPPRQDRLSWSDHHMLLALTTADRSPDPNTQVGSIVVDKENRIISTGYNGTPRKINPNLIDWSRKADDPCCTKYPFVAHGEENAIKNTPGHVDNLNGSTIFCTMHPCHDCARDILQAGIEKVVYLDNPYEDTWSVKAAVKMFELAQVDVIQHKWDNPNVVKELLLKLLKLVE